MSMSHYTVLRSRVLLPFLTLAVVALAACQKPAAAPQAGMHALPVQISAISMAPVPRSDEFVATIKSRQSATIQPQVDGNIVKINVHSGDHVKTGQVLMEIDPLKQKASLAQQQSTEQQKLAVYDYQQVQVVRQRKLYADGVISRDAMEQAEEAFKDAQNDYEANVAGISRRSSSWDTTVWQRRLTASSATSPSTSAITSLPPPCSPRWIRTTSSRPTSIYPPSAPPRFATACPFN